jgi:cytochrome c-type biogenesis protein CcmF
LIAEIGLFSLVLAFMVAIVQGTVPFMGAQLGRPNWMALAVPAAVLQLVFIAGAFAALTTLYVTSDFTVANVVSNSHSAKPLLYKITGVWGNHEGSMLLWVLILAVFGSAVALFGRNLPPTLKVRVLAVQGWISIGFLSFSLFTSNPFERVFPAPLDGRDLNPLLQDPGLAIHPPMLYLGYVGFSMAFSFAIAALIEGRVDAAWARWVRPWTLLAWCFLTAGIALGSWWAYYELGWGGWWFWDPVENVSLMPWIMGTALLHSSIVVEKRDALKIWTILLAILTFSLSLIGTFIVRSGLLTSVHAFATDPTRGLYILVLLAIAIGGSLILFAWRGPQITGGGFFQPVSRESGLVLNNVLLVVACLVVFVGTMSPLVLEAFGEKISIGIPYYNITFIPIMLPLIFFMALGPYLSWKRADLAGIVARFKLIGLVSLSAGLATVYLTEGGAVLAALAMAFAIWLLLGALMEWGERARLFRVPFIDSWRRIKGLPRSAHGMTLAHSGLAIVIFGMIGASSWTVEDIRIMRPGEWGNLGSYRYTLEEVTEGQGPNYFSQTARFRVFEGEEEIAVLEPEKRLYPVQQMPTTEAAIRSGLLGDLYAVIGEPDGKGGYAVRIYNKPLVPWLWVGTIIMVLGGLVSLSDRRLRVGAPRKKRKSSATSAPLAGGEMKATT